MNITDLQYIQSIMRAAFLSVLFGLTALAKPTVYRAFPHLVIPLDSFAPDKAYNTQQSFHVSKGEQNWTAANWDVPSNAAVYCQLGFTINMDPSRGAPWTIWGVDDNEPFMISIAQLQGEITGSGRSLSIVVYSLLLIWE
ncbi:uncharacterized protein N0V89_007723 [Didymosphaeria variabile]|uniref:Ubiquitin 3 binding protein But2 C-terminal domain-containing protein n=1 Tax=Didymosphaeria variabile TaxID=1932322 RepID=A0A9W9CAG7_9PLEO|nr:uncharacterized protein N0V89_007723 [Didymosphaeria variabile]KAJ4352375.1 hypothetical protein N0V89_007723 [Didymosphaeria variabile]